MPKGTYATAPLQLPLLALSESYHSRYCLSYYRRKCAPTHDVLVVLPPNDAPAAKPRGDPRGRRAPGLFRRRTAREVPLRQEQPESTSLRPFVAPDGAPRRPRTHRLPVRFGGRVWLRMRLDRSSVRLLSQSPHLRHVTCNRGRKRSRSVSKMQLVRLARGGGNKVARRGQRRRFVLTRLFRLTPGVHRTSNVTLEAATARQNCPASVCKQPIRSSRPCAFLNSI